MKTVNMHEAKTHLSKLVEEALRGEPFVIARAGKPLVKVTVIEDATQRRTGFLKGQVDAPDDFDWMGEDEILSLFEGREDGEGQGGAGQGRGHEPAAGYALPALGGGAG